MTSSVEVSDVGYAFGTHRVLDGVSFSLNRGLHFLVGVNGAGKTTLFRVLLGVLRPQGGVVSLAGSRSVGPGGKQFQTVGYLPQRFGVPNHMRVRDFVAYVAWLRGMPRKQIPGSVREALVLVDMDDCSQARLGELSGGMLRRVGVAQAIVHKPAILLLDEPTDGLDPRQRVRIRELIESMAGEMCVLVSTHLLEDIRQTTGEVLILDDGRIAFQGTGAALQEQTGETSLERAFLQVAGA